MDDAVMILGGGFCVWEDVRALEEMIGRKWPGKVVAVNDVGCWWPRGLDGWCTLHPEKLAVEDPDHPDGLSWIEHRQRNGHPAGYTTYARREPKLVHQIVNHWGGGSSGLYAVAVVYHKYGAVPTVLCGIPMTETGHFTESMDHNGDPWEHADDHWRAWKRKLRKNDDRSLYLQNNVRSMSGRTRATFGEPTPEWLEGREAA